MRKLFVFLALFGAGLALVMLTRRESAAPAPVPGPPMRAPAEPDEFTEFPVPTDKPDAPTNPIGINLDGKLDLIQRAGEGDTLKPLYELHAQDVDQVGGDLYQLHGLEVIVYNLDTGERRARLTSRSSQLRIALVDGKPVIGDAEHAELTDVELTLHEGAPIVPLTLAIPLLDWALATQRFRSDDRVKLSGTGLTAEGVGLDADPSTSRIVLAREGEIRLEIGPSSQVVLSSTGDGPLVVQRGVDDGASHIELEATRGARLATTGEREIEVTATELRVRGRQRENDEFELVAATAVGDVVLSSRGDVFRASRADFVFDAQGRLGEAHLTGDVVLEGRGHVFRAQRAGFRFDAGGDLVHADLVGTPSGTVRIDRLPEELRRREPNAAGAPLDVQISGAGPLALDFGALTTIDLSGPGRVEVPALAFTLEAQRTLRGSIAQTKDSGDLVAEGAVAVRYRESELSSEKLALHFERSASGEDIVDATAEGRTTLSGSVPGERPIALVAEGGLVARARGEQVIVPIARGVTISRPDPDGFEARATVLRDFDWRARTFVAEGDVTYTDARGHGSATRAVSRGVDDIELHGTADAPARYEFREAGGTPFEATTQALEIHARRDAVDASQSVRATVVAADRRYELASNRLHLDLGEAPAGDTSRPFHAEADGDVQTQIVFTGGVGHVSCDRLIVDGALKTEGGAVSKSDIRAAGNVILDYSAAGHVTGVCDLFTLDRDGHGRLSANPGQRVRAVGGVPQSTTPYEMTAEWIEFDDTHLEAADVKIAAQDGAQGPGVAALASPILELSTELLQVDATQVLLQGKAHAKGIAAEGELWRIDAGSLRLDGRWLAERALDADSLDGVHAWDGFEAELGVRARAQGERLDGDRDRVRIEGAPARLAMSDLEWESAWIQYDMANMLLATDRGLLRPRDAQSASEWSVTYDSMQPFDRQENTILVLRNPLFTQGTDEMRADWTLFWVDREEWRRSGQRVLSETATGPDLRSRVPTPPTTKEPDSSDILGKIGQLRSNRIARILSEVYIAGNVEIVRENERIARAEAIYLDIVDGHGWVKEADIQIQADIRGRDRRLRAKANWLRLSILNGVSLRADDAVVTSCEYDVPHYVIKTGDLRIDAGEDKSFVFSAKQNELAFGDTVAIPMPPLYVATDEKGVPLMDKVVAGNFAKFGTSVQASFNFTLGSVGKAIGKAFSNLLRFPDADLEGHWKLRPGYLGSRGILLGVGLEFEVPERFKLDMAIDGIPDTRDDKGLVRVPEDERTQPRTWFRARGRYVLGPTEWFDLAVSKQSDPGVQSEFFERDYLEYEQKDNYVHWRKASDQYYFNGSVKVLLEDRTDIEELPSLGAYRGLTPITTIGKLPILYRAYADAAYLRRRNGDPQFYEPFDVPFDDPQFEDPLGGPIGEAEVLRFDTEHRLEAPFSLGFAALRATPFVSARATAWNEGVDPEESPARAGLFAGVELSTTMWRRYGRNTVHAISPVVGVRTDLVTTDSGGDPVPFDRVEVPTEGQFLDIGFRSRLWKPGQKEHFDLDVRVSHAEDRPDGLEEGLQPVAVLTEFLTFAGDVPVGMTHDGRYATDDDSTVYSRTYVGFEPHPKLGIEVGYHRGLDSDGERLYEAASIGSRYRATSKWELELEQTVSIADDRGLGHTFLLRRLGHDFILEIEVGYRAGEGSSFGINVIPDLSYRRSGLGLIDRWLGVYR